MRLDLLLSRERFQKTFEDTLSDYLHNVFSWNGVVSWSHSNVKGADFLVNAKLNLIFPAKCRAAHLNYLASEYAFSENPVRHFFQKAYIHISLFPFFRRFFSEGFITVNPLPESLRNWCFLPGNNSIRILDFRDNTCVVLNKKGFSSELFNNLVNVRHAHPEIPGPKLLDWDVEQGWYKEKRIYGRPLNRISSSFAREKTFDAAKNSLSLLYQKTYVKELSINWLSMRQQAIGRLVQQLPEIYESNIRIQIISLTSYLVGKINASLGESGCVTFPVALTHGDFQPGNIFVPDDMSDESVYLIDWEYAALRCTWYDAMVFNLQTRFPSGMADRVIAWLGNNAFQNETLSWSSGNILGQVPSYLILYCFLLEDLIFRLSASSIPGVQKLDDGFLTFINELDNMREALS